MDPRVLGVAHGLPRAVDVLQARAGQRGDDRPPHRPGDRFDRVEVALAGDGEPGFDDVDPEACELLRDLELLGHVQRDAGRLLAIAQGRVEDAYPFHRVTSSCRRGRGRRSHGVLRQTKTSPADRHEEASASTGGVLAAREAAGWWSSGAEPEES